MPEIIRDGIEYVLNTGTRNENTQRVTICTDDTVLTTSTTTVTKTLAQIQDWMAVTQNTIGKSAIYDFSGAKEGILSIQAALDTTTAHTGTKFIVQISDHATSNEDWLDFVSFVALIGTAATDLIEDNPLAAGSTSITLTGHVLTVCSKWLFIEDGTLANSELVYEVSQSANAVVVLDGTTNAHLQNVALFNVAMTQTISIPAGVYRLRVLVDNTYDVDGSTLNYKVRIDKVT